MSRIYIAYGSNINKNQMALRCPTARVKGTGYIEGWSLYFKGSPSSAVATIEPEKNSTVPVLVWEIEPDDEKALDRYEGFPWLYRKEIITAVVGEKQVEGMVYIMNGERCYGAPSESYYETILQGYEEFGMDINYFNKACKRSAKKR